MVLSWLSAYLEGGGGTGGRYAGRVSGLVKYAGHIPDRACGSVRQRTESAASAGCHGSEALEEYQTLFL